MPIALPSCAPNGPVRAEKAPVRALCETARVFRHDHEDEQVAERTDHVMAAVFVADEGERTEALARHVDHGYFHFTWERAERGATAMAGWSFGRLDDAGAICRVVTFEGLVPGQPDNRS
jgi:hypothetical protein